VAIGMITDESIYPITSKITTTGFYKVDQDALNSDSAYHLSFDLRFSNVYDRAHTATTNGSIFGGISNRAMMCSRLP